MKWLQELYPIYNDDELQLLVDNNDKKNLKILLKKWHDKTNRAIQMTTAEYSITTKYKRQKVHLLVSIVKRVSESTLYTQLRKEETLASKDNQDVLVGFASYDLFYRIEMQSKLGKNTKTL